MCELTKDVRWKKVLVAGLVYLVVATVINQIEAILTMSYYKIPAYFGLWSKIMMPSAGPPPLRFFIMSISFSLLSGITVAAIYEILKENLEKGFWMRILNFTLVIFWISIIFFTLPIYLLFNVPTGLLISWVIGEFLIVFLATISFVKILK